MGWDYTRGTTKKDIIQKITDDVPRQPAMDWSNREQRTVTLGYDIERKCLQHSVRGNILWTVEEITRHKETTEIERLIGCYLLSSRKGEVGYKAMCEAVHPYYYSCPLSYLEQVLEACKEWWEGVRKHHSQHLVERS